MRGSPPAPNLELGHFFFFPLAFGFQEETYAMGSPGSLACLCADLGTSQSPLSHEPNSIINLLPDLHIQIFLDLSP